MMASTREDWLEYIRSLQTVTQVEGDDWEVYAISDVHSDIRENKEWIAANIIRKENKKKTACILAGDVASSLKILAETLLIFKRAYDEVFYLPGNHCLWSVGDEAQLKECPDPNEKRSSLKKLVAIFRLCQDIGVRTQPAKLGPDLAICPLLSWYRENDVSRSASAHEKGFDLGCVWPLSFQIKKSYDGILADFFLDCNPKTRLEARTIITFSHFLPRNDLFRGWSHLNKVMADHKLDPHLRGLGSNIHVCGHSHLNFDLTIHNVRYLQAALCYPRERQYASPSHLPKRIF